jgi:hypothetical protein
MLLTAKEVPCPCGHVTTLTTRKLMCIKCGQYVFYDDQEKKAHRRQTVFVTTVLVMALGFAAYFFVEMILGPLSLLME